MTGNLQQPTAPDQETPDRRDVSGLSQAADCEANHVAATRPGPAELLMTPSAHGYRRVENLPGSPRSADRSGAGGYKVGYGKPPEHSRFQKGKSGNARGRPKKRHSSRSLLDQALSTPLVITEKGEQKQIDHRTAVYKSLVARAIKGDMRATAILLQLIDQFELHDKHDTQRLIIKRVLVRPDKTGPER